MGKAGDRHKLRPRPQVGSKGSLAGGPEQPILRPGIANGRLEGAVPALEIQFGAATLLEAGAGGYAGFRDELWVKTISQCPSIFLRKVVAAPRRSIGAPPLLSSIR